MNKQLIITVAGAFAVLLIALVLVVFLTKRRKKNVYPAKVYQKWLDIQRLCSNKKTWAVAVVRADRLLEEALKHTKYKGKTIGERLVSAQRKLSDNDGIWYAHNLAKSLKDKKTRNLREADVKKALVGFRQALRDLEVLNGK